MQNNTFFGESTPFHVIVLNETTSTNDYLKQLFTNFKPLPEYTAIMAKNQTQGRGQRGTSWISTPTESLTASFLLKPINLNIQNQFMLTVVCSLAMLDSLKHFTENSISIKWPNDIYIKNKKVCGILIENKIVGQQLSASIVGIGFNVFQTSFPKELAQKATSLKIVEPHLSTNFLKIISTIQHYLYQYHNLLNAGNEMELLQQYNDKLFRRNNTHTYIIKGKTVSGKIIGVDIDGLLQIMIGHHIEKHDLKDIVYQL